MNNLIPDTRLSNYFWIQDPTDILFKDFFDHDGFFDKIFTLTNDKQSNRINYPVDIKDTKNGLEFQIAVVGLDKNDVKIEIKNDILSISYDKKDEKEDKDSSYVYRGITRKSFNFAWRINSKFDLSKIQASLDKGLLKILVPACPEEKPKLVDIK